MPIVLRPAATVVATEPLSATVSVNLTPADKARLSAVAASKGLSMSAWARSALLNQLDHS